MADMLEVAALCSQAIALIKVVDAHRVATADIAVAQPVAAVIPPRLADTVEVAATPPRAAAVAVTPHQVVAHREAVAATPAAAVAVVDTRVVAVAVAAVTRAAATAEAVAVVTVAAEAAMAVAAVTEVVDNIPLEIADKI